MKLHSQCIAQLSAALEYSDLIITPNNRLAAMLREWFMDGIFDGKTTATFDSPVRRFPEILSFDQWFQSRYHKALLAGKITSRQLIGIQEERVLWQQVITECEREESVLSSVLSSTVSDAQKASQLLSDSGVDVNSHLSLFQSLPDSLYFLRWQKRFAEICKDRELVSQAQLMRQLAESPGLFHQRFVLAGFEELTNIQRTLLLAASESSKLQNIELKTQASQVFIQPCDSPVQEIELALKWACDKQREQPGSRIAIVVKGLAQQRLRVQRLARKTFYGNAHQVRDSQGFDRFNLSMGYSLAATPLIKSLVLLIESITGSLKLEQWRFLFSSPYLRWGKSQCWQVTTVLAAMEASRETEFSLDELASVVEWHSKQRRKPAVFELQQTLIQEWMADHAKWVSSLRRNLSLHQPLQPVTKMPSAWLAALLSAIQPTGWPGASLNSDEYQQHQSFLTAVNAFESFDSVIGESGLKECCRHFIQFLTERIFQSETVIDKSTQPVQILGLLEASGQCFDALWLVGMSEIEWPQTVSPNPFIPIGLQIAHQMPGASVEGERRYAERKTLGFLRAGMDVVCSYPSIIDEMPVSLSPLVVQSIDLLDGASLGDTSVTQAASSIGVDDRCTTLTASMEVLSDTQGGKWQLRCDSNPGNQPLPNKLPLLPGGTAAVTDAINNPLQAYLRHRLRVDAVWPAIPGIQPVERGNMVHTVVEKIWSGAGTSGELRAMGASALTTLINALVEKELELLQHRRYRSLPQQFIDAEREVMVNTIFAWLTMDLAMPDAEVIGLEVPVNLTLEQCVIRGRIDKIERRQIDDKDYTFIVDYKTSSPGRLYWLSDPTLDPQLPAYVLALQQQQQSDTGNNYSSLKIDGMYLSHIKHGHIRHNGYLQFDEKFTAMPGIKSIGEHWTIGELCDHWLGQIQLAIDALIAGDTSLSDRHTTNEAYVCFTRSGFNGSGELVRDSQEWGD